MAHRFGSLGRDRKRERGCICSEKVFSGPKCASAVCVMATPQAGARSSRNLAGPATLEIQASGRVALTWFACLTWERAAGSEECTWSEAGWQA